MYENINDYELLDNVCDNDKTYMYEKYKPLINSLAKNIYYKSSISGIELNDLIQEGMIAFSTALDSYNEHKDASFYTFARLCIVRRMYSYIRQNLGTKNKILNESISVDGIVDDFKTKEFFTDYSSNPENMLISEEEMQEVIYKIMDELTNFESEVFELKIAGFEYSEIASILEKPKKAIDNAISRIKAKIKKHIKTED